jgi:hypothetical protein
MERFTFEAEETKYLKQEENAWYICKIEISPGSLGETLAKKYVRRQILYAVS